MSSVISSPETSKQVAQEMCGERGCVFIAFSGDREGDSYGVIVSTTADDTDHIYLPGQEVRRRVVALEKEKESK